MGPVKIGYQEEATDPVQTNATMPAAGAFMFLGRTPAEQFLTGLQIVAALLTIFLALRIIIKKQS